MQLIRMFATIFRLEHLPLWLHPYQVCTTSCVACICRFVRCLVRCLVAQCAVQLAVCAALREDRSAWVLMASYCVTELCVRENFSVCTELAAAFIF